MRHGVSREGGDAVRAPDGGEGALVPLSDERRGRAGRNGAAVVEVSDRQWDALRALCEGALPTFRRGAAVLGVHESRVVRRAYAEGWNKLDCRDPAVRHARARGMAAAAADRREEGLGEPAAEADGPDRADVPPAERVERVMNVLLREVERIGAAARSGRTLDKARIDGVWAMIRTLEKVEEFARERAGDTAARREAVMAGALEKIDRRIEELARYYAAEMMREQGGGDGEQGGPEGAGAEPEEGGRGGR